MLDAIVLSDVHLGSDNCLAERLCELLETHRLATFPPWFEEVKNSHGREW